MDEVKVVCPNCNKTNYFYPPRTAQLLDTKCVHCDEPLYMVLYDLQLPKHSQFDTQSANKTESDPDIGEVG